VSTPSSLVNSAVVERSSSKLRQSPTKTVRPSVRSFVLNPDVKSALSGGANSSEKASVLTPASDSVDDKLMTQPASAHGGNSDINDSDSDSDDDVMGWDNGQQVVVESKSSDSATRATAEISSVSSVPRPLSGSFDPVARSSPNPASVPLPTPARESAQKTKINTTARPKTSAATRVC
jgi:hypothetical protein